MLFQGISEKNFIKSALFWRFQTLPWNSKLYSACRSLYMSKIYLARSGLTWDKLIHACMSAGSLLSLSWFITCLANHILYFSLIKLAGLLTVISSGWNLLVYDGTKLRRTISSAEWKVSIIARPICSSG